MKQMNQFRNQVKVQQVFLFSSRICHSNTKQIDFWREKKKPQMKGKKEFLAICTEGLTVLYQIIPPPCVDFLLICQALGQPVLLQGILKRRASEIVSSSC